MSACPFCQTNLDESAHRGRCPVCGTLLDSAPPIASVRPKVAQANVDDGADDEDEVTIRDVVRTIVQRGFVQPSGPTMDVEEQPSSLVSDLPTPALLQPRPMPTDDKPAAAIEVSRSAAKTDADIQRTLGKVWASSHTPSALPSMTIKAANSAAAEASHELLIRSHRVERASTARWGKIEYELIDVIGEGGVGVVHSARQASIDRTVALKVLKAEYAQDADHRKKFLAEAVVTGELDHPNIVPIYDLGTNETDALFYAMKRVRGTPWSQVIGSKSLTDNLTILMSVADAIAFAHARGVIHRDLKPDNVMLGDYGEVLVMDWGIALPTASFNKRGSVTQTTSMGGTPAYMAPEMATGPLEAIGPASDIYLLGALLYEVLTSRPPHNGPDVMACLFAAAQNRIQSTEKRGELLDIALHAMATDPAARYADVQGFQSAIREYQSHSESVVLSQSAEQDLAIAKESRKYQDYARALFGFEEAFKLWSDNKLAKTGEVQARLSYAACALDQGDYDLGLSLLDPSDPLQGPLHRRLTSAKVDRNTRQRRFNNLRRMSVALALLIFAIISGAGMWIFQQKVHLDEVVSDLKSEKLKLETSQSKLSTSQGSLLAKTKALEQKEVVLTLAKERADREALSAKQASIREAHVSYLAQIGVAAERVDNNSFLDAERLLDTFAAGDRAFFRDWEWGYLRRLCHLDAATTSLDSRIECLAYSRDRSVVAAGAATGQVYLWSVDWNTDRWTALPTLQHSGSVDAVAVSADGSRIAVGGETGEIKLWTRGADGQYAIEQATQAHRAGVLCLSFTPKTERLLSGSRDETACLWQLGATQPVQLRGHFGPVWGVDCDASEQHVATAGEDGVVRIWDLAKASQPRVFRGHRSAVYAVRFSRTEGLIASAGRDRDILLWNYNEIDDFDFSGLEKDLERERLGAEAPAKLDFHHSANQRLTGHTGEVRWLDFAPDGNKLLSCGHDNTVRCWNLRAAPDSIDFQRVLRGHGSWVTGCAFSPDETFAFSVGHDKQLKVWDILNYQEEQVLAGHEDSILWASFAPRGDRVVTASRDRRALIWNLDNGQPIKELTEEPALPKHKPRDRSPIADLREGHDFLLSGAAFFPLAQHRLATAAGDNTVRIWDSATGAQVRRLDRTGTLGAVAVSDDGRWVLTGSESSDALLWDADNPAAEPMKLVGHADEVSVVAFSPHAEGADLRIVTGDTHGRCMLWRRVNEAWQPYARLQGHSPGYAITAACFTPDGSRVLTACQDHTVMQWSASDGKRLPALTLKHAGGVKSLDLSSDGRRAITLCAVSGDVARAYAWQIDDATHVEFDVPTQGGLATGISLLAGDDRAVLTSTDGDFSTLWAWDLNQTLTPLWPDQKLHGTIWATLAAPDGQAILSVGGNQAQLLSLQSGEQLQAFSPHGPVTSANYSASGLTIATSSTDGHVKIWAADENDPRFGKVIIKIAKAHFHQGRAWPVNYVSFDPALDSNMVVTAGDDRLARIWSIAEDKATLVRSLSGHRARVHSAVFSPDGRLILTASADRTARLWDAKSGEPIGANEGKLDHPASVWFADFSPDGRMLITACDDHVARVWDVSNLSNVTMLAELTGHTAAVTSVAISPDGRRALTGSQDGIAKVWDLETTKEVLTLERHAAELTSVHFSPNGRNLLTSALDQRAIVWQSINISPSLRSSETSSVAAVDDWTSVDSEIQLRDPDSPSLAGGKVEITTDAAAPIELEFRLGATPEWTLEDSKFYLNDQTGRRLIAERLPASPAPAGEAAAKPTPAIQLALQTGATPATVEALLRTLHWRSTSKANNPGVALIQVSDADGGSSQPTPIKLIKPDLSNTLPVSVPADEITSIRD